LNENKNRAEFEEQFGFLVHEASSIFDEIETWLTVEAEPFFFTHTSPQDVIRDHIKYPDIVLRVLDSVANTALLTINKILRLLHHTKLRLCCEQGQNWQLQMETSRHFEDPNIIELQRQRVRTAFNFVQGESILAAKPLEFGLRQVQYGGSGCSEDDSAT